MRKIYLDYAATTPLDPKVLQAMLPYLKTEYGNASSIHRWGQKAKEAIDKAREKVADFLRCSPSEIVFTASATEANNLAIFGTIRAIQATGVTGATSKKGSKYSDRRILNPLKPHIITTKIEHHAVFETCQALEKQGVEITYLPVDRQGLVRIEDVKKAIKPNTVLVSIMYANNEIGSIQPISEIGNWLKLRTKNQKLKTIFHTDAVQAVNYLDCDVQKSGVDLLTLSAHKIYGPKGVGALFIKRGTPIEPIIYGGGQEQGLRSGTENVAGIVGLGAAIEEVKNYESRIKDYECLRNRLIDGILQKIPGAKLNGSREQRLPNNVNFSFAGAEGEAIVIALDQEGIAASTGSACSSRTLEPSHVLLALGLTPEQAHGSLRLTLGRYTTEQEIERVLEVLPAVVKRLRKISGMR